MATFFEFSIGEASRKKFSHRLMLTYVRNVHSNKYRQFKTNFKTLKPVHRGQRQLSCPYQWGGC